jgi:hypothetical protein
VQRRHAGGEQPHGKMVGACGFGHFFCHWAPRRAL